MFADFNPRRVAVAVLELLSQSPPPDAIVALDDMLAIAAMRAAKQQGYRIPDDIAIVGFNDSPLCEYVEPRLTSVAVEIPTLARRATEMLIGLIEGHEPTPKRQIVPARLVKRGSV